MADEAECKPPTKDDDEKKHEQHRLWVGNIDKRLSEYNLLKVLQKFGEIKYFEFLIHKSGPLKGEPRGYCFVEYSNKEEALKTIKSLNGKMVLSRSLAVHWAKDNNHSKSKSQEQKSKQIEEDRQLTSLRPLSTVSNDSKIQAIEAKLRLMDNDNYSDHVSTAYRSKHPLLEQSGLRNKSKPYSLTKSKRTTEWKVFKKSR